MHTNTSSRPELLGPVARFFAHQTTDPEAVARCFTEDAVVLDEGRQHRGRAAIAAWSADSVANYRFTTEPLGSETAAERTTVTALVRGSFPGSPIQLRYRFAVRGELITRLEITP
ncbi:nuclear transport factor 2 family protein [Sandaracinus amylolyticus]|uniref:SnoaL-like domain-containing protein n=1 Tax=Sandaracinus amylolyticus TaxID=927083 RepID=A0A0F6W095_9BACT|nr:nuclear transport factor 2 family protein [Sandaracinus amylolyticus]AKF03971.1 hypothetical protein DB32_001120 [Sandaracinus amylolyticus]